MHVYLDEVHHTEDRKGLDDDTLPHPADTHNDTMTKGRGEKHHKFCLLAHGACAWEKGKGQGKERNI